MRDTVNLVRQGVPSVVLVEEPFEKLARLQAAQLGMAAVPILVFPRDLPTVDPSDLVAKKAREVAALAVGFLLGSGG